MKPLPIILRAKEILKPGTVLDLGAGTGHNGLYLAEIGFEVTLVDKDVSEIPTGLPKSQIVQTDLMEFVFPEGGVDNVLCNFVLHFLGAENALEFVKRIQNATHIGGINVISDFTGPIPGDLRKLYEGWELVHYEEATVAMRDRDYGTAMHIIARKLV